MKQHHTILYVPGLGDRNLGGRQTLLNTWRFRHVTVEICTMQWTIDEPWEIKLQRLTDRISALSNAGETVSLVGESAGASAVIQAHALCSDDIQATILLCGKSQFPDRVAGWRYKQNPALKDALIGSSQVITQLSDTQKQKILNLHPLFDPTVPVPETRIPGVKNSMMPIIGHATSIVFANTLWSWRIVRFARKKS